MNARTGKPYLGTGYAPATFNHAVAVLAAFHGYHAESGLSPVVSPVPPRSRDGRRLDAHHNPLEPFRLHARPRVAPCNVMQQLGEPRRTSAT